MRILIVEDDFLSRRVLTKYLAPFGDCEIAVNGIEAVEAFTQALAGRSRYGLVCLDIVIPGMDGQEVLKTIRQKEKEAGILPKKEVKVIMTTALQTPKDVFDAFYQGGCTSYLTKPVERKTLLKLLEDLGIVETVKKGALPKVQRDRQ
jgi:two-component system, chemotaxis family, chemotaxis protein CheY